MSRQIQVPMPRAGWNCEIRGRGPCSLDEFGALIQPRYRIYTEQIRRCVSGLTVYAAQEAAAHRDSQLPMLRQIIIEMACYWTLDGHLDKDFEEQLELHYGGDFDRAVSEARQSGLVSELTDQAKQDVLTGLEVQIQELSNDDGLGLWIQHSSQLADQLQAEWRMELMPKQQDVLTITMEGIGGMTS